MNEPGPVELDDLCDRSPRGPAHPSVADHAMQSLSRRPASGDPVGSLVFGLAGDLCLIAVCEGMPPEEIERTAEACRRAAEICYGKPPVRTMTREEFDREQSVGIDPNGGPDRGFIDPGVEGEPEKVKAQAPADLSDGPIDFNTDSIPEGISPENGEPKWLVTEQQAEEFARRLRGEPPPAGVEGSTGPTLRTRVGDEAAERLNEIQKRGE